jgi:hypothetical protein
MELTKEKLINETKADIERVKQAIKELPLKIGNDEYRILRNKLSVLYAKLKYHTEPECRLKKLNDYNKWYEANIKTNKQKKYIHIPTSIC